MNVQKKVVIISNIHFPVCVYFFDNCPPQFLVTGNPLSQCSSLQKLRCLIFKKSNSNILLDVQNYIIGKRFLPQSHLQSLQSILRQFVILIIYLFVVQIPLSLMFNFYYFVCFCVSLLLSPIIFFFISSQITFNCICADHFSFVAVANQIVYGEN